MTFVPSSWGFTCVHKISPVDVSPTLNFPKHMVHKCRSPAQLDSEGTASLSTGGIEGRKTSERRSMRDSSVQGKDHSALSSIPLCSMFPFVTSFILVCPCGAPGADGFYLEGLSSFWKHSVLLQAAQHHPAAPSLTLPPSPLLPFPPSRCGLTQRNLKIRCDV